MNEDRAKKIERWEESFKKLDKMREQVPNPALELWITALQTQMELQEFLKEKQGVEPTPSGIYLAIVAETGELVNSVGSTWKWWKRNDKKLAPVDRERALDELADILHFVLAGFIITFPDPIGRLIEDESYYSALNRPILDREVLHVANLLDEAAELFFDPFLVHTYEMLEELLEVGRALVDPDLTREELVEAYLKKAEVNRQRWEEK